MTRTRVIRYLKMLAPYLAVGLFWCGFQNAWLAILAYHAQILFWSRGTRTRVGMPGDSRILLLALPAALAGPLAYVLLPIITHTDLAPWLVQHRLSGWAFVVMIPYFGLVHPFLEQRHWGGLREQTPVAHLMFAGYHMLVLYSLVEVPWLALCFTVLAITSMIWQQVATRYRSAPLPVVSHMLADLGIVIAAWLRM